jgi:glycosyltransferase involved in cell wall biosynthesis
MSPPRVALVTYALRGGGMETMLLRLGAWLRAHDVDARIVTTVEPGDWFPRAKAAGIPAEHVHGAQSAAPFAPIAHARRMIRHLSSYDVVFLNHAAHVQAALGQLPGRVVAIPVLHNDMEVIYRVGCANPGAWNAAVAVSPRVAQGARERVGGRPVLPILNGVEIPSAGANRTRRPGPVRLVYAGRLWHEQKGVLFLPPILTGCVARGLDVTLDVLGDGPDRQALERAFRDAGVSGRVRLHGMVAPGDVLEAFLRSDVLLMPSFFEGLPVTLLEAQACGCVPVASLLPGITDLVVKTGISGELAPIGDIPGFVEAVARATSAESAWAARSHAAHASVRDHFSIDAMGASYLTLIHDSLAGRHPLPRSRQQGAPFLPQLFDWKDYLPPGLRRAGRTLRDRFRRALPAAPPAER